MQSNELLESGLRYLLPKTWGIRAVDEAVGSGCDLHIPLGTETVKCWVWPVASGDTALNPLCHLIKVRLRGPYSQPLARDEAGLLVYTQYPQSRVGTLLGLFEGRFSVREDGDLESPLVTVNEVRGVIETLILLALYIEAEHQMARGVTPAWMQTAK